MKPALSSSVDDLDAARRKRATRWIADVSAVLIAALTGFGFLRGLPGSELAAGALSVPFYVACGLVARSKHWKLVSPALIGSGWIAVWVTASISGRLAPAAFFLGTGLLYAAATMTPRGVLVVLAGVLATLGLMMSRMHLAVEAVPRQDIVTTAAAIYASMGLGAILVAATMRTTLQEAYLRERQAHDAETRALEGEARYRLFADHTDDLVSLLDATGMCVYVSPSHARVLGVDPASMVGHRRSDIVLPEDRDDAMRGFTQALEEGRSTSALRLVRSDGDVRHVDVVMNAVEHLGGRFVVSTARDVTKQRQLAEQLQQAQKMDALGRLAGGVAHDFNNLLTIVQICTTHAVSAPETSPRTRAMLEEALMASTRAAELTRQLLRFSRKDVVAAKCIALGPLLSDAITLARRLVGPSVEVSEEVPASLHEVSVASTQIEQIVLNLASNARDAMPGGGKLRIRAANDGEDKVQFSVSDSGSGMSEDALEHLFEPFFTTKQAGLGTGLGLSTCYGIVEQLHGTITVDSRVGGGATFTITLPRATRSREVEPLATAEAPPRARPARFGTVLVVEDQHQIREQMCRVVEALGHQVRSATGLEEARSQAAAGGVDVLLTDIVLGSASGLDVMRLVRGMHPHAGVVLTSGFVQDADEVARHVALGAEFLPKPFTEEELGAAIGRAFAKVADEARAF